ncbi:MULTISPECIES: TfoX/Sxy family protein [unclassified Minwuia]|jgi:DNA transformation protein and related proteins|uniref:TfoX/Sxy family protein n=1 Tax=unclassified Minwuia TaxID=2618799 RepID=UPI0024791D0A|nr:MULTISPECIES: TfoX/Sxy family protein [unclassified Minwuia]
MAISPEYREFALELFDPVGAIAFRRMFGGAGLFHQGLMFALIIRETIYMKVDDVNRPDYEAAGSEPFTYETSKGTRGVLSYFALPEDLYDDQTEAVAWALRAIEAAGRADAAKPPSKRKRKS